MAVTREWTGLRCTRARSASGEWAAQASELGRGRGKRLGRRGAGRKRGKAGKAGGDGEKGTGQTQISMRRNQEKERIS